MKHLIGIASMCLASGLLAQTPLDIERAREMDLDGLQGLGPATTRLILQERDRQPFANWQDLMRRVSGIGRKKAAQLSVQGLRVQGQPYRGDNER